MEATLTLVVVAALVSGTILWLWALADVLRHPQAAAYRSGNQVLWTLVIAVTHILGAAVYLAVGRRRRLPRARAQ